MDTFGLRGLGVFDFTQNYNPRSPKPPSEMSAPTTSLVPTLPSPRTARYRPQRDFSSSILTLLSVPSVSIDLVIMTVKETEFLAVFELLQPLQGQSQILRCLVEHSIYYFGLYGRYHAALLASHTAGIERALHSLGNAIRLLRPRLVVNVGIAWGADPSKQRLGDVLVADRVVNIDNVKVGPYQITDRGPMPAIDARTEAIVNECKRGWKFQNLEDLPSQVHLGLYLGSNTLLNNPQLKEEFLKRHPEAIGGEMEGYAIYAAAAQYRIPWLVIKGISDWGDGTKSLTNEYHNLATASAASFLHTICTEIPNLIDSTMSGPDITGPKERNNIPEGKTHSNLNKVVTHFQPKRFHELKTRMLELQNQGSGLILCAITGVPGTGKTELAKAYARRFNPSPQVFRWRLDPDPDLDNKNNRTNPNKPTQYEQAYSVLLDNFNLQSLKAYDTETREQMDQRLASMVWQKINQYPSWIVIFDNAGTETDIAKYLPSDTSIKGIILVTSQTANFFTANPRANFSVNNGLDPDEAIKLLHDVSGKVEEDLATTRNLVRELDYLPLGIRTAGSYIRNVAGTTFGSYTKTLQQDINEEHLVYLGESFIAQSAEDLKRVKSLRAAIRISIFKARDHNPPLFHLLKWSAFIANDEIPVHLLLELSKEPGYRDLTHKKKSILDIIGQKSYSLLTYDERQTCYIHQTTQVIIRHLTNSRVEIIKKLATVILQVYPYKRYFVEELDQCQRVVPHFTTLSQHISGDPMLARALVTEQLRLWLILGQLGYRFSQYTLGLHYLEQALKVAQESPNEHLELQAEILRYLAHNTYYLRDYQEARSYIERSVIIGLRVYGLTNWYMGRIYNVLGKILKEQAMMEEATMDEALRAYQRAEDICMNCRDRSVDSELELAYLYQGVASCLRHTRDFAGALYYLKKAQGIYEQNLGPSDPYTASVYKSLGTLGLYPDPEKFDEDTGVNYRESLYYVEEALSIYKKVYGPRHYRVANSYHWRNALLDVRGSKKDWNIALRDQDEAIKIYIQICGEVYQDLVASYYVKGRILQRLDRDLEAGKAYHEALKVGQKNPGRMKYWVQKSQERLQQLQALQDSEKIRPKL